MPCFVELKWPFSDTHVYFSLRYPSRLCFHIYIKQVSLMMNLFTDHRGYERIYKFKEQDMNRSTFCEIKYMNRLGFFSKARYMIGVGFKIRLAHRYQNYHESAPPPPLAPTPGLKLFTFSLCKLCAIKFFATSCLNYAL